MKRNGYESIVSLLRAEWWRASASMVTYIRAPLLRVPPHLNVMLVWVMIVVLAWLHIGGDQYLNDWLCLGCINKVVAGLHASVVAYTSMFSVCLIVVSADVYFQEGCKWTLYFFPPTFNVVLFICFM